VLLIPCPWCGPRNEDEFHYGGQAGVAYPDDPAALSDAQWAQYLFFRDNPKGEFAERWVHTAGCRRWFTVHRSTADNTFLPTSPGADHAESDSSPGAGRVAEADFSSTASPPVDRVADEAGRAEVGR
jgi:heterotetrameric sarcosine oxidase delta subunit